MPSPEELMYSIVTKCEQANQLARSMLGTGVIFGDVSGGFPKLKPAELGFLRCVSWLFLLLFEAGRINVQFLMARREAYQLDGDGKLKDILDLIQKLRTYTQHNLNPLLPHDRDIVLAAEKWLSLHSGTALPDSEVEWGHCLEALLREAQFLVEGLVSVLRSIEKDEDKAAVCDDWKFRLSRQHFPNEFDELIPEIAADLGHDFIDSIGLRKRYFDRWVAKLRSLNDDYDFRIEARRLIEGAILAEQGELLPITGSDLIRELKISPGRPVGELLKKAKELYTARPQSRQELLDHLRELISKNFEEVLKPPTAEGK